MATQKVIFFTAGPVATAGELEDIGKLNALTEPRYDVKVRNGGLTGGMNYGAGIEDADLVAGTIPTAYSDAEDYPVIDPDAPPPPTVNANQKVITSGANNTNVTLTGTAGAGKTMVLTIAAGVITAATFT